MDHAIISKPLHSYYNHAEYRGLAVPPFTPPSSYSLVEGMEARSDDLLIATYPKSGTTWLQTMVYSLLGCPNGPLVNLVDQVPWLQETTAETLDTRTSLTSPRIFKTHDRRPWLPGQWAAVKAIYCYRNPKDWAVSWYHHMDTLNYRYQCEIVERGDFGAYFSEIARAEHVTYYGLWEDHVIEWLEEGATAQNILLLNYEDLVEDTEREVREIAAFLGVELTMELKERVLHEGKLETMKKNDAVNYSRFAKIDEKPFIRKGKVGGWKEWLTEDQSAELDVAIEKVRAAGGRIRCTLD